MEPTFFEQRQRKRDQVVIERRARAQILSRIFQFTGLTIDDVVNDAGAKKEVYRWFRVLDDCLWEG
ncbi:hypothetical protein ACFL59_08945, partial [Planctomycetota bacterium]